MSGHRRPRTQWWGWGYLKMISYFPRFFSCRGCFTSSRTLTVPKSSPPSAPAEARSRGGVGTEAGERAFQRSSRGKSTGTTSENLALDNTVARTASCVRVLTRSRQLLFLRPVSTGYSVQLPSKTFGILFLCIYLTYGERRKGKRENPTSGWVTP